MHIEESMTVAEVASAHPHTTRTFERLGIDYCCGGKKTLREACMAAKAPLKETLEMLQGTPAAAATHNWKQSSLAELIGHIVGRHHAYVKEEMPRIERLLEKVCKVHGAKHPELMRIHRAFLPMAQEMSVHMFKEEQVLFPYMVELEEADNSNGAPPRTAFGSIQNPIRMMLMEHDSAGAALREIRSLSSEYHAPEDSCVTYKTLYGALQEFEADLHEHVHLENNILFPRAEALETKTQD